MSRNFKHMNARELRKQLLIAESELNRVQLTAEHAAMHSGLRTITHGGTATGAIASSASMVATHLAAMPPKQRLVGTKPSRLQTVLHAAVLIATAWLALIPRKT